MPISATGTDQARGFTLVELMVALFIIGLAAGAVLLSVPPARSGAVIEAERLAGVLGKAGQEAVLVNRQIEVAVSAQGYEVRILRAGQWNRLDERPFAPHSWSPGLAISTETADGSGRFRFDQLGLATTGEITFAGRDGRAILRVDEAGRAGVHVP